MRKPNKPTPLDWQAEGHLVSFPAAGRRKMRRLDGFYRPGGNPGAPMLAVVHGMGSNFYRSAMKKAFLEMAPMLGMAVLSFDNRGAGRGTEDEPFGMCMHDLDAMAEFARRHGHRRLVVVGHSTGCQKVTHWHARRGNPAVAGIVLLAPVDDQAAMRRDLGRKYGKMLAWAKKQVAAGRNDVVVPGLFERLTPRRFLSVADPRSLEAKLFNYDGPLTTFRRLRCSVLAVFGENEEFAVQPPAEMLSILRKKTRSVDFDDLLVPGADHGFHGCELELAQAVCEWGIEVTR